MLTIGLTINNVLQNKSEVDNVAVNSAENPVETVKKNKNLTSENFNYFCENSNEESRVNIQTPRGDKTLFILKGNDFDASGWTKEKRGCHIANKLQSFQNKGTLENIKAQEINNYPTICVPDEINANCTEEQILVTIPIGNDANEVLTALTNNPDKIYVSQGHFSYDNDGNLVLNLEAFVNNSLRRE